MLEADVGALAAHRPVIDDCAALAGEALAEHTPLAYVLPVVIVETRVFTRRIDDLLSWHRGFAQTPLGGERAGEARRCTDHLLLASAKAPASDAVRLCQERSG